jgi:cell division control protein 45
MLNCGGVLDVGEFFNLNEDHKVYVVDSRRPVNLVNAFGNAQVAHLIRSCALYI